MPNNCVAIGYSTGHDKKKSKPTVCDENSIAFYFLLKEEKLLEKWIRYVSKQDVGHVEYNISHSSNSAPHS